MPAKRESERNKPPKFFGRSGKLPKTPLRVALYVCGCRSKRRRRLNYLVSRL
jgi:hypothetical protein